MWDTISPKGERAVRFPFPFGERIKERVQFF
jgi:hypothetical protein